MKKICALILALLMLASLIGCHDNTADENRPFPTPGEATANNAWPSAVYDPFGIPAFSDSQLSYCVPGSAGTVYLSCTREAFLAYIETLRAASFRLDDTETESISTDESGSFSIYMPKSGGQYSISCWFSFENEGAGILTSEFDEASQVNISFVYNVNFSLKDHGEQARVIDTEALSPLGLNAGDFMTDDALSFSFQIYTTAPYKGIGTVRYPFDADVTEEVFYTVSGKIIDACCGASDNGKIRNLAKKEQTAEEAKADRCSTWMFTKDGKNYLFVIIGSFGYGASIGVSVTSAD